MTFLMNDSAGLQSCLYRSGRSEAMIFTPLALASWYRSSATDALRAIARDDSQTITDAVSINFASFVLNFSGVTPEIVSVTFFTVSFSENDIYAPPPPAADIPARSGRWAVHRTTWNSFTPRVYTTLGWCTLAGRMREGSPTNPVHHLPATSDRDFRVGGGDAQVLFSHLQIHRLDGALAGPYLPAGAVLAGGYAMTCVMTRGAASHPPTRRHPHTHAHVRPMSNQVWNAFVDFEYVVGTPLVFTIQYVGSLGFKSTFGKCVATRNIQPPPSGQDGAGGGGHGGGVGLGWGDGRVGVSSGGTGWCGAVWWSAVRVERGGVPGAFLGMPR
jgi:hypothetical protein